MKTKITLIHLIIGMVISINSYSNMLNGSPKQIDSTESRLKIFLDCQGAWCDMIYIKTEINILDFVLNRYIADVHVLVTSQYNGSGGQTYQLIFYGQNKFKSKIDTLKFFTSPTATEVEIRDIIVRHLKFGLFPFVVKTGSISLMDINMKNDTIVASNSKSSIEIDKWNLWVIKTGLQGSFNTDQNYRNAQGRVYSNISKTTENIRIMFNAYVGINSTTYNLGGEDEENRSVVVKNTEYAVRHMLAKSITNHFSIGYFTGFVNSTFSNTKGSFLIAPAAEYNIFDYKEINNRSFTVGYRAELKHNSYYDTTIYDKMNEFLTGHTLSLNVSCNQKWGQVSFGAQYSNYFQDFKLNQLSINTDISLRVSGNLFIDLSSWAALTHNQVNIAKGDIGSQDVLTRKRQLQSGFNVYSSMGISYRMGSKVNNVVNPRFNGMF